MITRRLPVNLNDSDILERGQRLAQAEHDYASLEGEKKTANDNFKKSLDATGSRITDLSVAIRDRVEIQDVEVFVQAENGRLQHEVIRRDTGETVETYPFTESEKQKRLFVEG